MSDQIERDEDEIVRYYQRVQPHDVFGIWGTELLLRVPLKRAIPFMAEDHGWDEESWAKASKRSDKESIVWEMEEYFQFAVEKAITHSGAAASRSVHHYLAWTWLIKDLELFAYLMEPRNYPNYGCPLLLAVAQKYEIMELLPDNKIDREVFSRMANGQVCGSLCNGGCRPSAPTQFRQMQVLLPGGQSKGLILPK